MLCRPASASAGERRSRRTGHPGGQVGRVEGSDPGGGELEGEWQPVEVPAHVHDRGQVGRAEIEVRTHGPGPVDEQGDRRGRRVQRMFGVRQGQRGDGLDPLALDRQSLSARRQHHHPRAPRAGSPRRAAGPRRGRARSCRARAATAWERGSRRSSRRRRRRVAGVRRATWPAQERLPPGRSAGPARTTRRHRRNWPDTAMAARPARRVLPTPPDPGERDQPRFG